jgi:hypothetical protein
MSIRKGLLQPFAAQTNKDVSQFIAEAGWLPVFGVQNLKAQSGRNRFVLFCVGGDATWQ